MLRDKIFLNRKTPDDKIQKMTDDYEIRGQ